MVSENKPQLGFLKFGVVLANDMFQIYRSAKLGKNGLEQVAQHLANKSLKFPKTIIHNLGTYPSDVQVWFRVDATSNRQYRGVVQRQIVTTVDESDTTLDPGDTKTTTLLVPSVYVHTSEINVTVQVLNVSSDPAYPDALFTDSSNVDQTAGEMRVIARR